jgi:hypothetical protein
MSCLGRLDMVDVCLGVVVGEGGWEEGREEGTVKMICPIVVLQFGSARSSLTKSASGQIQACFETRVNGKQFISLLC